MYRVSVAVYIFAGISPQINLLFGLHLSNVSGLNAHSLSGLLSYWDT
jgi:hypothetical protein